MCWRAGWRGWFGPWPAGPLPNSSGRAPLRMVKGVDHGGGVSDDPGLRSTLESSAGGRARDLGTRSGVVVRGRIQGRGVVVAGVPVRIRRVDDGGVRRADVQVLRVGV